MLYHKITDLIGNTPLLEISSSVHGIDNVRLYAKLEYYNPFGSVKDRIAWGILKDEIKSIQKENKTILEMSSGNTAKALQAIASVHGVPFKTITNRIKVEEVKDILKVLGTEIQELPGKSDCHDPNDPNDPLVYINREVKQNEGNVFFTSQYSNQKNIKAHYETTGEEILNDLKKVDYFFGGVGTSGSTRGPSMKIQERDSHLKTFGIVATKGDYIPGIRNRDEVLEVGLFTPDFYESILEVSPAKAIDAEIELIQQSGVLCGPTSGAVYQGIKQYFKKNPASKPVNVVFIVCDRMEWYMSYLKERKPELFGIEKEQSVFDQLTEDDINEAPEVDVQQLKNWVDDNEAMIVDIRSNIGYRTFAIPNSVNIPKEDVEKYLNKNNRFLPNKKLVFVCSMGNESKKIAAAVKLQGYEAYSLKDGVFNWREIQTNNELI